MVKSDRQLPRIIVMLTNACNLRCTFCNIWQEGRKKRVALRHKDVLGFLRQMLERSNVHSLAITGGEPFEDLLTLVRIYRGVAPFMQERRLKYFNITTNGSYPQRVERFLKILPRHQRKNLNFNISMDGLEKVHDAMRGKPVFKTALRTLQMLVKNNVAANINCMITPLNATGLFSVYQLAGALGVGVEYEFVSINNPGYYHYSPRPCHSSFLENKDWKKQTATQLRRILEDKARFCKLKQVQALLRSLNDDGFEAKICQRCRAPQDLTFIRATGEIYACPYEEPLACLEDFSWDVFAHARTKLVQRVKSRGCHRCLSSMGSLFQ